MNPPAVHPPNRPKADLSDTHSLSVALEPVLREVCGGRLGEIEWFHSTWQHSGAATGFAKYRLNDHATIDVMVKMPVGPAELRWTSTLGAADHSSWDGGDAIHKPTPRVVASGAELGGYDLGWLVVERLNGQLLSTKMDADTVLDLLRVAADFHEAAGRARPVIDEAPKPTPWEEHIARAREATKAGGISESQHWNEAVKRVQRALPQLVARWNGRVLNTWCHGDLHPGNAMHRRAAANGDVAGVGGGSGRTGDGPAAGRHGCVLVDMALVHPGHWVEDALYLERQYWGHAELLHGVKPVSALAKIRRDRGLPTDDQYAEVAMVRRVLMAACAPAFVEREGNPKYLHAALELINQTLPQVIR
ncbi:MAG: aminoglycoside phosphotransferase family protein [Phycisphaerales bacterium]|nr:aminoglycoside phosphotransferase family protein [Phycisphaerales bacterium]